MRYSIVIPTYNRPKLCQKLLYSINDALDEFPLKNKVEIIIVEDGSKTNLNFSSKHKIEILRNKENKGLTFSRNLGIKSAKGKYIIFFDDDIVIPTNYFNILDNLIENYPIDILGCRIYCNGKNISSLLFSLYFSLGRKFGAMPGVNLIIKKTIFNDVSFDETFPWLEDLNFFYDMINTKYNIYYSKKLHVIHKPVKFKEINRRVKLYTNYYFLIKKKKNKRFLDLKNNNIIDLKDDISIKKKLKIPITKIIKLYIIFFYFYFYFIIKSLINKDFSFIKIISKIYKQVFRKTFTK